MAESRAVSWTDGQVRALISIWGESRVQEELDGAVRNKSIYEKIARRMKEAGYVRSWKECRQKIKNLKNDYKKIKDEHNKTGTARRVYRFFEELDRILGARAATEPPQVLESSAAGALQSQEEEEQEEELSEELFNSPTMLGDATLDAALPATSSHQREEGLTIETEIPDTPPEPPAKKQRRRKATAVEKVVGGIMERFVAYQEEAEARFLQHEEQRCREDREHEERLMRMMISMISPPPMPSSYYNPPPLNYPYPGMGSESGGFPEDQ